MPTWKSVQPTMKAEIRAVIYQAFMGFSGGLEGLSNEDQQSVQQSIGRLADELATGISQKVYEAVRKTRKQIFTFGTMTAQVSLPISAGPDANAGGILFGMDEEFDRLNPEN